MVECTFQLKFTEWPLLNCTSLQSRSPNILANVCWPDICPQSVANTENPTLKSTSFKILFILDFFFYRAPEFLSLCSCSEANLSIVFIMVLSWVVSIVYTHLDCRKDVGWHGMRKVQDVFSINNNKSAISV